MAVARANVYIPPELPGNQPARRFWSGCLPAFWPVHWSVRPPRPDAFCVPVFPEAWVFRFGARARQHRHHDNLIFVVAPALGLSVAIACFSWPLQLWRSFSTLRGTLLVVDFSRNATGLRNSLIYAPYPVRSRALIISGSAQRRRAFALYSQASLLGALLWLTSGYSVGCVGHYLFGSPKLGLPCPAFFACHL